MDAWEVVKRINETSESDVERTKATLIANYGPEGHAIPDVIDSYESLEAMVLKVCERYEKELKNERNKRTD